MPTMASTWTAALPRSWSKLPSVADKDIGNILKTTGMTLISSVGGASGPFYGTLLHAQPAWPSAAKKS